MIWQFIDSGFNSGKYNMEFDVHLAQRCRTNEAFFRLYRWKPYCISLGYNQNFEDVNLALAARDSIDIVKRPTGGRAILHAEEITYSVVFPLNGTFTPAEIYRKISQALSKGLSFYNSILAATDLETVQPDFINLLKEAQGIACFASTAKSEVKYNSRKLIGSAQRKMNNIILQHGSILCGNYHLKIADYLNLPENEILQVKTNLKEKTIDLKSILKEEIDYIKLSECLVQGFEQEWQISFQSK